MTYIVIVTIIVYFCSLNKHFSFSELKIKWLFMKRSLFIYLFIRSYL